MNSTFTTLTHLTFNVKNAFTFFFFEGGKVNKYVRLLCKESHAFISLGFDKIICMKS